jgi:hypothetical protein
METLPKSEVGARSRKEVGSFLAISNSLPHSIRASLDLLVRASTSTALRFQQAGWQSCLRPATGCMAFLISTVQMTGLIDLHVRACTEPGPMSSLLAIPLEE